MPNPLPRIRIPTWCTLGNRSQLLAQRHTAPRAHQGSRSPFMCQKPPDVSRVSSSKREDPACGIDGFDSTVAEASEHVGVDHAGMDDGYGDAARPEIVS